MTEVFENSDGLLRYAQGLVDQILSDWALSQGRVSLVTTDLPRQLSRDDPGLMVEVSKCASQLKDWLLDSHALIILHQHDGFPGVMAGWFWRSENLKMPALAIHREELENLSSQTRTEWERGLIALYEMGLHLGSRQVKRAEIIGCVGLVQNWPHLGGFETLDAYKVRWASGDVISRSE